jgi:hypothetical protein
LPDIESCGHVGKVTARKEPEEEEGSDQESEDRGIKNLMGKAAGRQRIKPDDGDKEEPFSDIHVAELVGAELGKKERASDRLQDIDRRNREEKIAEHQEGLCALPGMDLCKGPDKPGKNP